MLQRSAAGTHTMNLVCLCGASTLFLLTPPALLAGKALLWRRMPWWLLVLIVALVGWFSANARVYFYFEYLEDQIVAAGGFDSAPSDLTHRWEADGAARVFAALFGWLYGPIYLLPWIFVYGIADCIREWYERGPGFAATARARHRLAAIRAQADAEHGRAE